MTTTTEHQKRAEQIVARVLAEHDEEHRTAYGFGSPVAAMSAIRKIATAAALAALTEEEAVVVVVREMDSE